jgi:hypothetical protein
MAAGGEGIVSRPISASRITASTLGERNPAHVGRTGYYHYKNDPLWYPGRDAGNPPPRPNPGGTTSAAAKAQRLAVFRSYRALGLSVGEAGKAAGVGDRTAREYEREPREGGTP